MDESKECWNNNYFILGSHVWVKVGIDDFLNNITHHQNKQQLWTRNGTITSPSTNKGNKIKWINQNRLKEQSNCKAHLVLQISSVVKVKVNSIS